MHTEIFLQSPKLQNRQHNSVSVSSATTFVSCTATKGKAKIVHGSASLRVTGVLA